MTSTPESSPSPQSSPLLPSMQYPVTVWESIAIAAGALLLIAVGLAGLGIKALNNAFDPRRAEATAGSIASYQLPGGAKGVFGTNLGGGKLAVVSSIATVDLPQDALPAGTAPPAGTELFLGRIPITEGANNPRSDEDTIVDNSFLLSGFSFSHQDVDSFQINAARTENRLLCGSNVPVTVQTGNLIVAPGAPPIPAVRYQAETTFKEHTFVAIVSTLGETAENHADLVFDSLRCR